MSGPVLLALRLAMVLALYAFLGWALYTLWQDLRRQGADLNAPQAPPLALTFTLNGAERSVRFNLPEINIGRDPASDLPIEDKTISAQHACLSYHHGQWWVEDLRSTNGTYLNQEPVHKPLVITSGDELRCGQVVLEINIEGNS